jgi:hypothetical protein
MKTNLPLSQMMASFLLVMCGSLLSKGNDYYHSYPTADEQAIVGRDSTVVDILIKSDAIFVGKILQIKPTDPSAHGEVTCLANSVSVSQVLKGALGDVVSVDFKVRSYLNEKEPKIGTSYIFFVKRGGYESPNSYTLLKLLPATDANIAKVKALIAAATAPK